MIVEVHGCSTRNKGAELMMLAIKQHYEAAGQNVQLAVDPWFGTFQERAAYGLLSKLRATRMGRSALAMRLMPRSCPKAIEPAGATGKATSSRRDFAIRRAHDGLDDRRM